MKTQYYTHANIDQQAKDFLHKLQSFRDRHKHNQLSLEKAALLVIDMQNFFFDSSYHAFLPSMAAITPKIKKVQNIFLEKKLPVIQTQHGNTQENAGQMHRWWQHINDVNDPYAEIIDEIKDPRVPIIKKTQYDSFWKTNLEEYLHNNNITQVIITGVMSHLCCETTARAAFVRGFEVFFVVDCTATFNEDFHFATLRNLAHGFALPILSNEIFENLLNVRFLNRQNNNTP